MAEKVRMLRARIKRMGKQFATCGIPVRPPRGMEKRPGIKYLCPRLVPGQVIELPEDHNLFNQDSIEVVRRLEPDEFLRPWVFATAEQATLADPSKANLAVDAIRAALSMAQSNAEQQRAAHKLREAKKRQILESVEDDEYAPDDEYARSDDGDDDGDNYTPDALNKLSEDERNALLGLTGQEPEPELEPEPAPVAPRRRRRG